MGILDDIAGVVNGFFNTVDGLFEGLLNPQVEGVQLSEGIGDILEDIQPIDEGMAVVVDAMEESVLSDLQEAGVTTPDEVEAVVDNAAGVSATWMGGVTAANAGLEFASVGQLDSQAELLEQAIESSGLTAPMGREIEARLQEGIDPALKQMVHREHRSKQINIQDWVEVNRDARVPGGSVPARGTDVPGGLTGLFADVDFGWLPDPDTYGVIPGQEDVLEFASLESLEPEEIIEEAPQKGVIPNRAAMEQVLYASGLPTDVAEVYLEVWDNLPKTAGVLEDSLRLQNVLFEIDNKVRDGVMEPETAVAYVRTDVIDFIEVSAADGSPVGDGRSAAEVAAEVLDHLERHWQLLWRLPNGPPTGSDIETWYEQGQISIDQFSNLWQRFGSDQTFWANQARAVVIDQNEADIRKANLLGRLSTQEAEFRLRTIGWDSSQASQILAGADPASLLQEEAAEQQSVGELPAEILQGVSPADQAVFNAVGLGTVGSVADASVSQLVDTGVISDERAQSAIEQAQNLLQQSG